MPQINWVCHWLTRLPHRKPALDRFNHHVWSEDLYVAPSIINMLIATIVLLLHVTFIVHVMYRIGYGVRKELKFQRALHATQVEPFRNSMAM